MMCGLPCVLLRRAEMEITNRIKQLGGKESPTAALRELECGHLLPDTTQCCLVALSY